MEMFTPACDMMAETRSVVVPMVGNSTVVVHEALEAAEVREAVGGGCRSDGRGRGGRDGTCGPEAGVNETGRGRSRCCSEHVHDNPGGSAVRGSCWSNPDLKSAPFARPTILGCGWS